QHGVEVGLDVRVHAAVDGGHAQRRQQRHGRHLQHGHGGVAGADVHLVHEIHAQVAQRLALGGAGGHHREVEGGLGGGLLGRGGGGGDGDGGQALPVADVGGALAAVAGPVDGGQALRAHAEVEVLRAGEAEGGAGVGVVHLAVGGAGEEGAAQGVQAA